MIDKKAFTLIELLVVVLIIGILAAIALPKYERAVMKSRYAGLMPLAKSVKQAQEEMLMSRGKYATDLTDLAVQVPGTPSATGNSITNEDGVKIELYNGEGDYDFVKASKEGLNNTYVMYFDHSGNFPKEIHCEAKKDDPRAIQLCKSYGPQIGPIKGTAKNYEAYVLEGTGDGVGSAPGKEVVSVGEEGSCGLSKPAGCRRTTYDDKSYMDEYLPNWSSLYDKNGNLLLQVRNEGGWGFDEYNYGVEDPILGQIYPIKTSLSYINEEFSSYSTRINDGEYPTMIVNYTAGGDIKSFLIFEQGSPYVGASYSISNGVVTKQTGNLEGYEEIVQNNLAYYTATAANQADRIRQFCAASPASLLCQ